MKEKIDLINEFLDGNLSGHELKLFEEQMSTDTTFAERVKIIKGLRKAIPSDKKNLEKEKAIEQTLSKLSDKHFAKPAAKKTIDEPIYATNGVPTSATDEQVAAKSPSLFPRLAAAASIALLIFGGWYFMSQPTLDVDKLVSVNFVKTSNGDTRSTRSPEILPGNEKPNINANLEKAAKTADLLFKEKKYSEAKEIYNSLLAKNNDTISKAIYNGNNINWDAMIWNCVLVEVGLGNNNAAKEQIEAILKSDITRKYKERAEALRERL